MKRGPFITLLSQTLRLEERTLAVYYRALREAGWIETGSRGINAPHATPRDAALLTLAVMATDRPAEAVQAVETFGTLTPMEDGEPLSGFLDLAGLGPRHTVLDVLTFLFAVYAEPERLRPYMVQLGDFLHAPVFAVRLDRNRRTVTLEAEGGPWVYHDAEAAQQLRELSKRKHAALDARDWQEINRIAERQDALLPRIGATGSGLRIAAEVTVAEVEPVALALAGRDAG